MLGGLRSDPGPPVPASTCTFTGTTSGSPRSGTALIARRPHALVVAACQPKTKRNHTHPNDNPPSPRHDRLPPNQQSSN